MKILFQSRTTLFTVPGGDTIQIVKTKEYLEKAGVHVDISTELEPDVSGYDLVHLFNLTRPQEVYLQALNAKKHNKKIVLSTIYVSYSEYDKQARHGISGFMANVLNASQLEYLKIMGRAILNREVNKGTSCVLLQGFRNLQNSILTMTDVLLPNSVSELTRIANDFVSARGKINVVVPNAMDAEIFNPAKVIVEPEIELYRNCVLSVARIEGRKCQLNLVRAMKGLPWKLVLIGKPAPNHVAYYQQIRSEAGPEVYFLGEIEHRLLPQFYKVARIHALVSWMETTGLSSLEAGAMGCNLVITARGDTKDYFGDSAFYCEPDSVESIRSALIHAYEAPLFPALAERILRNYTWDKTAEKTLEGYALALKGEGGLPC